MPENERHERLPENESGAERQVTEKDLRQMFHILAEVNLALHMVFDDDARKMKEMEHAIVLRESQRIEELRKRSESETGLAA